MKRIFILVFLLGPSVCIAQEEDDADTPVVLQAPILNTLPEATVRAFELNSAPQSLPASIGIVSDRLLRRYGNASIVQAVNTVSGVRMEERSSGSYRLAIRGSSLRAPFGVRNVKIYYNGIPFTDPGGGTYLNELGYYNFSRIEIIKGPGSSLYGSGTGGVALIESLPQKMQRGFGLETTLGSYGLINLEAEARTVDSSSGLRSIFRYQHFSADGYREHSAFRRDVASWDAETRLSATTSINAHFFYTDLHYETPGALTLAEYEADPRSARPTVGPVPGAVVMNAAIAQKAFLAGATLNYAVNEHWSFATTLYGAFTALDNPTLRNYGRSSEPNAGGRATLKYRRPISEGSIEWLAGIEGQQGLTGVQIYSTRFGNPDTLQTDDKLHIRSAFSFTQAALAWRQWLLTAGVSINTNRVRFARFTNQPYTETVRDFNNEAAPRVALLYKVSGDASAYASVSRGFSPPTSAELSPSGGMLNEALQPESGWNYELGVKGAFLSRRLSYDAALYYFALSNTIVQRRDALGGDYFLNSGSTEQIGAELGLRYRILEDAESHFGNVSAFAAYSYQHFRYKEFMQVTANYSGNAMPGISPNTIAAGLDWESRFGLYARLSYYYSDIMPLNDAGATSLPSYQLFAARIGYKIPREGQYGVEIFAGGENLGDVRYSAGPDINGFGGRYYNAAPGRNFYAGIALQRAR